MGIELQDNIDASTTQPSAARDATPSGVEQRRHPRVALEVEVDFYEETNFYTGFTDNISEGGLFVATYGLRPIGTVITLRFVLPDGHEVEVEGRVRWLREPRPGGEGTPGMGIEFGQLRPADEAAIREFARFRAPLFHED